MATPIETNTQELENILQQVYDLPNRASGGTDGYDLVIGLDLKGKRDSEGYLKQLYDARPEDVSIISGSITNVKSKIEQKAPPRVALYFLYYYDNQLYYEGFAQAYHVSAARYEGSGYVNDDIHTHFFTGWYPPSFNEFADVKITLDSETGLVTQFGIGKFMGESQYSG